MEAMINRKKANVYISKLINLLAFCFIAFLMAFSSNALLFNPFILSAVWFSYRLSPFRRNTFLLSLTAFSFLIELNYGVEIALIVVLIGLIDALVKFMDFSHICAPYLSLSIVLVFLSIRYMTISFSFGSLINCLVNTGLSLILAVSMEKTRFSLENPSAEYGNVYKIMVVSFIYSLFMPFEILNLFALGLLSLVLIRTERQEIVLSSLLLVFIYNYLFFSISNELMLIYLIGLFFASFSKKTAPFIFAVIVDAYYVIRYPEFYRDIAFYFNLLNGAIVLLLPKKAEEKISSILKSEMIFTGYLQNQKANLSSNVEKLTDYLTLLKKDPIEERDLESDLIGSVENHLCTDCPKNEECHLRGLFSNFLVGATSKEDKNIIIRNCYYPYKLIKRFDMANKSFQYQVSQQESRVISRQLFNRQIDTLLKPLQTVDMIEKKEADEAKFELDYCAESRAFSEENGDAYRFIECGNKTLFLLSDGMGHGTTSSELSSYCIEVFTSMYSINKNEKETIQNLNLILKTKTSEEIFATLDLASIDLSDGTMRLFKGGSFSTFLVRGKELTQYNKIFPPLGIIDKIDIFYQEVELRDNDLLIFMSDGFGDEVDKAILSLIDQYDSESLNEAMRHLYDELSKSNTADDKTLVLIKIKAK